MPTGVRSSKPGDGHARYELVLDIQRELKRAGCYGGTLSGSWSANTKRAMAYFMERVNATLPIEDPDYILLTLIKGQADATCISCPLGQALAEGRCVPNAIIAQSQRKSGKPAGAAGSFTTSTAVAAAETGVRTSPRGSTVTTMQTSPSAAPPLPGRMSIGGPRPAATPAPPVTSEQWNVRIVPSASTAAPSNPVVRPKTSPSTEPHSRTAALQPDAAAEDATGKAALPEPGQGGAAPIETGAVPDVLPITGLPGTKSGSAATAAPGYDRPAYVAPRPQRAARPAAQRQRASSRRGSTRSVHQFFMHPLGRM